MLFSCIRSVTQCMSLHALDQGFSISVEGWGGISRRMRGYGKFCRREFSLYGGGNLEWF